MTSRGENSAVVSLDRITFKPSAEGIRITYDADLALRGPFSVAGPLLGLAFSSVGDRALAGLRATLLDGQKAKRLATALKPEAAGAPRSCPD